MTAEAVLEQMVCPECHAQVQFTSGFVAWCPGCDWNVDPIAPPKLSWRDRRAAEASARASRKLYERIAARGVKGPPPRSPAINLIAALVHLLTAIVFAGGVLMLAMGFGIVWPLRLFFGALLIAVAFQVQPFWHRRRRRRTKPMRRDEYPALYGLVDDVA